MTNEEIIEQFQNAIDLIKQNGKDWLDERDIPMLKVAIRLLKNEQTDGDLISRQAVITMLQKIENAIEDGDGFQFNEWIEYANDIPSAEKTAEMELQNIFDILTKHTALLNDIKMMLPSAEKTAEWVYRGNNIICSNCGEKIPYGTNNHYCRNCGAKMEESEEKQ